VSLPGSLSGDLDQVQRAGISLIKIEHYDSIYMPKEVLRRMSEGTRKKYERFMEYHWKVLRNYCPHRSDQIEGMHHTLVAVDCDSDRVLGYRYFYFPVESNHCELFNVYVESNYRRKGIATSLIKNAIDISIDKGINKFTVSMAEKSVERDSLVRKYTDLSKNYCQLCQFTILYEHEVIQI